ncbi:unnamed protein product, partial [Didymodactylos carnosus]
NKSCLASPKEPMIENNINLISLSGVTPRRYLLNVEKVLLTPEQLGNGFLPDFRGKREGRVPITQEDVDKLTEAVRCKFSFKTEDMQSLWRDLTYSLTPSIQFSDDEDSGQLSDIEVIDDHSTSSSSVDSDEDEQMLNELLYNVKYDSDNRPIHEYTQYGVSELSIELLNFFRASRLPENLRKQLLKLVSKYMPVPNNIPLSTSEILCSVGLQKFYSNDRGIPSPILFNILFDVIIRKVVEEARVNGVQFSYGSNDFYHGARENYENFNILALLYAVDLMAMCETADDLETFIRTFEKVTQDSRSVKKTCIMTLQRFEEDHNRKLIKDREV